MFGRLAEDVMLRLASGFPMLIHPTLSLLRELVSAIGVRLELVHGRAGRSHEHHIAGLRVGAGSIDGAGHDGVVVRGSR